MFADFWLEFVNLVAFREETFWSLLHSERNLLDFEVVRNAN